MIEKSKSSSGSMPAMQLAGAMPLTAWRKAVGVSRTTVWNWRQSGKLKVIYRYGRAFVSAEENRRLFGSAGSGMNERTAGKR